MRRNIAKKCSPEFLTTLAPSSLLWYSFGVMGSAFYREGSKLFWLC